MSVYRSSSALRTAFPTAHCSQQTRILARQASTRSSGSGSTSSLWLSKTHLKSPPAIPAPLVPTYPMRVVLSDGSTFTAYTTAPTPSTKKMTRDVLNNPLWSPASERKGLGEGDEGRVGRFRRRFEGVSLGSEEAQPATGAEAGEGAAAAPEAAFGQNDFDWMSEGAKEEKVNDKQRNPTKAAKGKGGKKK